MRPNIKILEDEIKEKVFVEAMEILEEIGFFVENQEAIEILQEAGLNVDVENRRVKLPPDLVKKSLQSAPSSITLFDREGKEVTKLEGDNICFDPGSAALNVLDPETNKIRTAVTKDFIDFTKVVEQLEHIHAQSTAIICSDVPEVVGDRYRLYLALIYSKKPIVTGTFAKESFEVMKDMLIAVRGDEKELKNKPLAIFDACPSPPLKWSNLTCQSIIDCAKYGIPSEFVSMPMTGANAPVTLLGAIVQHAAETLAGLVITQLVSPGAPVIWGGSPAAFDMRKGTMYLASVDTILIDLGYTEIGKYLNLPTHAYLGMSDAKILDMQAGFETGMGTLLAGIKGVNMISGAGMMNFESTQSIQKVVIDNEIAGMTFKFINGIIQRDEPIAKNLLKVFQEKTHLLAHDHTLKWFREELYLPSEVVDRSTKEEWISKGRKSIGDRANEQVKKLLKKYPGVTLDRDILSDISEIIKYKDNDFRSKLDI
ncbi:MAG: trimethylamine methyltransferase family protein [Candidatus Heimdallarchaeota archaeon]|nr:trimethylamine methyltransferase family protein [Candidatus Heimdallarchaeota archaeon]MCK4770300.1 trimethylamine methyltransferase family protein [Candidatus Heimdallarchaeota archaeon]